MAVLPLPAEVNVGLEDALGLRTIAMLEESLPD